MLERHAVKVARAVLRRGGGSNLSFLFARVKDDGEVAKKRNCLCEHPFGTIKRGLNQGYLLLKGLKKVGGEIGLTMLVYNIRRVINILGVSKLMEIMDPAKA